MSRSFLKYAFSLLLLAGISTASFAQDDANMPRPNTKAGSAAWMFEFGGLGSMGLSGFGLPTGASQFVQAAGWKWYFADDMALRALLGFTTSSSGNADSAAGSSSSHAFGIAVGVEMHTHPVYSTSPYFGAQISFGTGGTDHNQTASGESKSSVSAFGIGVLAGFDWYFTRGIAIGGEYMLGFSTTSSSTTNSPKGGSSTTIDAPSVTNIGISSASVHAIVHF